MRPSAPQLPPRAFGASSLFLVAAGPPYERAGWGSDVVNVYLDGRTDWQEVAELLTESYCVMAPKRLAALVSRSGPGR